MKLKTYLFYTLIFCIILAGLSCMQPKGKSETAPSKLTILYEGSDIMLGPSWDSAPKFIVFLPLISRDKTGALTGCLAQSWEHSADGREWIVRIRQDIKWHDGVKVTAHDIKFNYDLLSHPDIIRSPPGLESIVIIDDFTIKFSFKELNISLINGWQVFYPKHLLEDLDPKEFFKWDFWKNPIGNGPFRFVRCDPETVMEFTANPDYYLGKPKIERLVIKFGGTPLTEILSGNVDMAHVSIRDVQAIEKNSRFRIYYGYSSVRTLIFWNQKMLLFRDPLVRQAMTMAIDRRTLHQILNFPGDAYLTEGVFTISQLIQGDISKPLPYNQEMARNLLEKAGWKDKDQDGIRELGDEDFKFTLITGGGNDTQAAVFIQNQLSRVGIGMEIQTYENGIVRNHYKEGSFEAIIWRIWPRDTGGKIDLTNLGYNNSKVITLYKELYNTVDMNDWDRISHELSDILNIDIPFTMLYPGIGSTVAHQHVHGLTQGLDFNFGFWRQLGNLWIEEFED